METEENEEEVDEGEEKDFVDDELMENDLENRKR